MSTCHYSWQGVQPSSMMVDNEEELSTSTAGAEAMHGLEASVERGRSILRNKNGTCSLSAIRVARLSNEGDKMDLLILSLSPCVFKRFFNLLQPQNVMEVTIPDITDRSCQNTLSQNNSRSSSTTSCSVPASGKKSM